MMNLEDFHEKLRILFIGFNELPDKREDEIFNSSEIKTMAKHFDIRYDINIPTIYDYHLVLISDRVFDNYDIRNIFIKKIDELKIFLSGNSHGIIVCPLSPESNILLSQFNTTAYIIKKSGNSIKFNENHWLSSTFEKYTDKLHWDAHLSINAVKPEDEKSPDNFIATNLLGFPISIEMGMNSNLIFIPYYDGAIEKQFLRDIIDKIKQRLLSDKAKKLAPAWVNKYSSSEEQKLLAKRIETDKEMEKYEKIKGVLWQSGNYLTESITFLLNELGINSNNVEINGKEDIIISEDNLSAIIENKGIDGYANNDQLRQLLEWYMEKIKTDTGVKGIFILNEFRSVEPEKRSELCKNKLGKDYPFTEDAIRIAENNNFCLLTTFTLFKLFLEKTHNNFDKNKFIEKLAGSKGYIRFEDF